MSIVTRTGDGGDTGLFGSGRVSKADPRMQAIGDIDELNAAIAVALAVPITREAQLLRVQHLLFRLGASFAVPAGREVSIPRIQPQDVATIDAWIAELEESLPPLQQFIVPGGGSAGAQLHLVRAVCRRAERSAVAFHVLQPLEPQELQFLNRLSDFFFLAAREEAQNAGISEVFVSYD